MVYEILIELDDSLTGDTSFVPKGMSEKNSDILHRNLSSLVENTDLSRIVPFLENKRVLGRDTLLRILNSDHDVKAQTRNLYTAVLKRGPQAFLRLRDALQESNHIDLANLLIEMDSQDSASVAARRQSCCSLESCNSEDRDSDNDRLDIRHNSEKVENDVGAESPFLVDVHTTVDAQSVSTTNNCSSNLKNSCSRTTSPIGGSTSNPIPERPRPPRSKNSKPSVTPFVFPKYCRGIDPCCRGSEFSPTDDVNARMEEKLPVKVINAKEWKDAGPLHYKMNSYPRGCALIVNNIEFHDDKTFPKRNGAENDQRRLKELLEQFYFGVEFHRNKTRMEMNQIVRNFSNKEELKTVDCVVVVFMSHGAEGASEEDTEIIGVDGIGYKTREIVRHFSNENCHAMVNKPKVFIFQACRGILNDEGTLVDPRLLVSNRTETDGRKIESVSDRVRIRTASDVFIAYAVPPGRPANRDIFNGTWFIQTIIDIFSNYAWKYDLEDMLKMVDNKIKNRDNLENRNFQAVSTTTIGWNKKLFFNPGLRLMSESTNAPQGMDVVDMCAGSGAADVTREPTRSEVDEIEHDDCAHRGCFSLPRCIVN